MMLGSTLSLVMLIQVIGEGSSIFIQASSIFSLIVISIITFSYHPTTKLNFGLLVLIFSFALVIILGTIRATHHFGLSALLRPTGVILFLLLGLLLARRKEHHLLERAFPLYAITLAAVLVYVLIDNDRYWGRLQGHLHSNLWAFIAGTAVVGVLSARIAVLVKLALISFFLYMLAIEFNARGALIWAAFTLVFFLTAYLIRGFHFTRRPFFYFAAFAFTLSAALSALIVSLDYILYDVMAINSSTRGLTSGLTGRVDLWVEFWVLFLERPVFGHGFDMSRYIAENYLSGIVPGDTQSTHNSYLTILFDFGLVGFSIYFSLTIAMLRGILNSKRMELAPFFMVYLLSGLTESRPLNVGNPSGMLFVLLIPYCAASAFGVARKRFEQSP